MSLVYKNDTYNYNGKYEMSSLNKFAQAERRLSAKKQVLDDMKNEYDLIEQQAFCIYKENVQYMLLDQPSTIKTCKEAVSETADVNSIPAASIMQSSFLLKGCPLFLRVSFCIFYVLLPSFITMNMIIFLSKIIYHILYKYGF